MKYIVEVTTSNPSHEHVSLRRVQKKTNFVVEANSDIEALNRVRNKFRSLGHYVHNVALVEQAQERPVPNPKAVPKTPAPGTESPAIPGHPLEAQRAKVEAEVEKRKKELQKKAQNPISERISLGSPVAPQLAAKDKIAKDIEDKEDTAVARINKSIEDTKETDPEYSRRVDAFKAEYLKKKAAADAGKSELNVKESSIADRVAQKQQQARDAKNAEDDKEAAQWLRDRGHSEEETKKLMSGPDAHQKLQMKKEKSSIGKIDEITRDRALETQHQADRKVWQLKAMRDASAEGSPEYDRLNNLAAEKENQVARLFTKIDTRDRRLAALKAGRNRKQKVPVWSQPKPPTLLDRLKSRARRIFGPKTPPGLESIREEVEQIDEATHFLYTGTVNGNKYELTIPRHNDISDFSDKELHRILSDENPHLAHHEVTAIVNSGGDDESTVNVEHEGETYTHHVINDQEPRRIYNEEVEQIDEGGHIYTKHPKTGELHRVGSFKEMPLGFYNVDDSDKPSPSAKETEAALAKRNPHLDPEHIKAIRLTSGQSNKVGKFFINHNDNSVGRKYIKQELGIRKNAAKLKEEVEQVDEVTPPGREKQVRALKGKVKNPYAVAWASYNKSKNKSKMDERVVPGLPPSSTLAQYMYLKQKKQSDVAPELQPVEIKSKRPEGANWSKEYLQKAASNDGGRYMVSPDKAKQYLDTFHKEGTENKLIGSQHKIDVNKNGELDAHDFKLLRAKKVSANEAAETLKNEIRVKREGGEKKNKINLKPEMPIDIRGNGNKGN